MALIYEQSVIYVYYGAPEAGVKVDLQVVRN